MALALLKSHKLKATKQRQELLAVLQLQRRPQTVEKLQAQLDKVSLATVYRIMDDFLRAGMVNRVDLGHGHTHFEYADPNRHHHHLICDDCGKVTDITIPNEQHIMVSVTKRQGFQTRSHAFEFFGLCRACQ